MERLLIIKTEGEEKENHRVYALTIVWKRMEGGPAGSVSIN